MNANTTNGGLGGTATTFQQASDVAGIVNSDSIVSPSTQRLPILTMLKLVYGLEILVILFDLWKTLSRATFPEPIKECQEILGYITPKMPDPTFLRICLTTNEEDPDKYLEIIASHFGLTVPLGAKQKFKEIIVREKTGLSLFAGVREDLEEITKQGYRIGLLSNVWPFPIKRLLNRSGLEFEHCVTSCETGIAKPDPGIFAEAVKQFGVKPENILVVGDNPDLDIRGAINAGMHAVHVDHYGDCRDFVEGVPVISDIGQLYRLDDEIDLIA